MNRNNILSFGIAAFAVVWIVCLLMMAPGIEADILHRATKRLDISSLPLNVIDVQGRDIVASGVVDRQSRRDSIIHVLNEVEGVRHIEDKLEVAQRAAVQREPAVKKTKSRIVIRFAGDATVLHGVVSSEQQRVAMIDIARQFGPDGTVHDRLKVVEGIDDLPDRAVLGLIARVLSAVEKGSLRADSAGITIEGIVFDESARINVGRLVRAAAPGVSIVNALRVFGANERDAEFDDRDDPIEGQVVVHSDSPRSRVQNAIAEILHEGGVDFVGNTASLTAHSLRVLNRIAGILLEYPKARLEISGHTDDLGNREVENELSRARAQVVVDYIGGRGVARSRLRPVGYGSQIPNRNAGALDQRIEFHVDGEE